MTLASDGSFNTDNAKEILTFRDQCYKKFLMEFKLLSYKLKCMLTS
jgi:hypothetical protein